MFALATRTGPLARRGVRFGSNHPSFEHHADWAKNKWKPALFVFGFASIGLIVPAFGISFAQWKARG